MPTPPATQDMLKLVAFDNEGLEILSAHCQDAVLRVADIAFVPKERRFALILNRFDWENAHDHPSKDNKAFRRRRSALRFECVTNVQRLNIDLAKTKEVKSLLAIRFQEGQAPNGTISLIFAGNSEIKLEVECIEAILQDLGAIWETKSKPEHPETNDS